MQDEMNIAKKGDKGFTLIELLIVIVILGILATVTVFAVRGITDKGQVSACKADRATMETASEAFFAQYGGTTIPVTGTFGNPAITAGTSPELTLVAAGLVRSVSSNVDVSAAGVITAVAPCTAAMIA